MTLLSLPTELLSHIGTHVTSLHALNALARVNRWLYAIFNPLLYQRDAQRHPSAAISWAAEHGKIGTLRKSLSYGAEIPVHSTIGRSSGGAVRMFHGKEIPRYFDFKKFPAHPLCLAVKNRHADIVEFLVAQGCDVNMRNPEHFSLLCVAVIYHHAHLVKILLGLGARQDSSGFRDIYSPIQIAAFYADTAAMESLLHHGNSSQPTGRQIEDALECALREHHRHIIQPLLDSIVNLNYNFKNGRILNVGTPLLWAVEEEDIKLVRLFLNRGADPNFTAWDNKPALLRAVEKKSRGDSCSINYPDGHITKILLENGIVADFKEGDRAPSPPDYNECNFPGRLDEEDELIPPLILAVGLGNADLVRLLVAHGANVNVGYWGFIRTLPDCFNGGPLLLAMKLGDQDIVKFLRDHGAEEEVETPMSRLAAVWESMFPSHSAS